MSYGINAPSGLVPSQYLSGALWTGQTSEYNILSGLAASIYTGDPVIPDGAGGITIATAGVGNPTIGSFQGCKYIDTSGVVQFSPFWVSGTVTRGGVPAVAFVTDDPNILYDVQIASGAGGAVAAPFPTIALVDLGSNYNLQVAQGTTYTPAGGVSPLPNPAIGSALGGRSVWYLNTVGFGAGPTIQMKAIRYTPVPGNGAGVIFNNALCLINNHPYKGGTGTAGI
jgi:hypothetical protein